MLYVLGILCFVAFANGQTQCGGNLVQPSGDVYSPNYPNAYPAFLDCMWTIPARGGGVTVEFKDFSIEEPDTFLFFSQCNYDYVEIIVGDRSRGRYCGTDMPTAITTRGDDVHIRFVTDELINSTGFHFAYAVQHELAGGGPCGSHLEGNYGVVTSPG
ncbi:procollagen C-endopeptidase enhancer 1-like [Branchiostoma lanceolatum]|uniref:procollagen C-endopeptidase enhancer 1-like n=1 Tax=Branchiostoma lanceolatum TaxID=7740 RepID=UPI003455C441